MTLLKNNLLFNHTYLDVLTSDTSIDHEIPFFIPVGEHGDDLFTLAPGNEDFMALLVRFVIEQFLPLDPQDRQVAVHVAAVDGQLPAADLDFIEIHVELEGLPGSQGETVGGPSFPHPVQRQGRIQGKDDGQKYRHRGPDLA